MARYELGDQFLNVTFDPTAPATPSSPVAAPKTDHKAKFGSFDKASGAASFDVPACDPTTEEPLIGLEVVYVPTGTPIPTDAAGFRGLPSNCPKASLDLAPAQFGTTVSVPRPPSLLPNVQYLGQAIHVYAQ